MIPAVPPPAIKQRDHFKKGDISPTTDAVRIVPATIDAGNSRESMKLSSTGI